MKKMDKFEQEILDLYEADKLLSTNPSQNEKEKFKVTAQATVLKDKRVNIRLSTPDLMDIQARALEDGMPYQTLIASILHKYVNGKLIEKSSRLMPRSTKQTNKQHAE